VEFAGACYHLNNRGNYRADVFDTDGAKDAFLKCLFEAAERFGWILHAFVIMRNHFHLVLELTEPNLSLGMKWLQGTWAVRFNRFRGEVGKPFQGRFKSRHVEPGLSLARVIDYDHLNPVKAGIVTADRAMDYRWSSLHYFMKENRPKFLCAETLLRERGQLPDTAAGWKRYVRFLEAVVEADPQLKDEKFAAADRGWVIGSREFKQELLVQFSKQRAHQGRFRLLGSDRGAHREVREALWEEKLRELAKVARINLNALGTKKSAPDKVLLAAAMKTCTSVSNGWLAKRLAMGQPGSAAQCVRRFRLRGAGMKKLRTIVSKTLT
jgi:REP element-mobilizing transposase RayT